MSRTDRLFGFHLNCARIFACLGIVLALAASYWSLLLSYAGRLGRSSDPRDLARAHNLAPQYTAHLLRWYDLARAEGVEPPDVLERALATEPGNAEIAIRAGLAAERRGDLAAAERLLLRAAGASRLFQPRSALANFYFRRGREPAFWRWFELALERAHGDLRPLFHLAWTMRPDAPAILARARRGGPKVLRGYLYYLRETGRPEAAGAAAAALADTAGADATAALLEYVAGAIGARQFEDALATWNRMCRRGLLPYQPLDPAAGSTATNGSFSTPPLNTGFDWRMTAVDGVSSSLGRESPSLRVSFSGRQPEACEALFQVAPVRPSTAYRLRFDARTHGVREPSGLRWNIAGAAGGAALPSASPEIAGETWRTLRVSFETPAATRFIRLGLRCDRPPGASRIAGELQLRAIALEPAP